MIIRTHHKDASIRLSQAPIGTVVWLDNRTGKAKPGEADWYAFMWVREGRKVYWRLWTWHEWHRPRKVRRQRWPHIIECLPARLRRRCG